jgi:hypothetical protein
MLSIIQFAKQALRQRVISNDTNVGIRCALIARVFFKRIAPTPVSKR